MIRLAFVFHQVRCLCTKFQTEMKFLNVAEKNDAAKTLAGFLSNGAARRREGYSVYNKIYEFDTTVRGQQSKMVMTSVSGHLMNYEFVTAYRSWNTCDPQQLFDAPVRKSCIKDNEPIKRTLEREIRSCQGLILWTDCDREGENIGFEIVEVCKAIKPNIPVYRAKFSEITAVAARRALANLTQPDKRQSDAVDIRQELDLRTGAAFTRYQTLRLQRIFPAQIAEKLISYGSCQIPTLGFVAARYKEAEEFVSEPFWKIRVTHTIDELTVEFLWDRNRLFDKEACEDYLLLCLTDPIALVENVTTKAKNKWRPVAMDTIELEKLGSRKLKINAKTVMTIAEKLYQQGYISYPRTETNKFSKEINLRGLVEHHTSHPEWGQFANRVLDWGPNPRNGNKSDEAHPPIHPIKLATSLTGNEQRVYELVVRHFLACLSKDATGSETVVNIKIAGEKFHATGLVIFERNYLDVYPYEKWNAKQIHHYEIGQTFEPTEISMQEGATTAPPLLTEADLIALMDKHGIGTDATHAEHINTVKERGYIGEVDRGFLVPGTIGMGLYEGYHAIELPLAEPDLRAGFEADLKKICTGEKNPKDVLNEQIQKYKAAYCVFGEKIRAFDEQLAKRLNETPQQPANDNLMQTARLEEVLPCPKCSDSSMVLKQKKDSTSSFLTCARYPDCRNAVWFPDSIKAVKVTENTCNRCGTNHRMLEFKFSQVYYLAMLNASEGTYSTCIVCDAKFRELFQINLDNVKRVGAIISDRNPTNSTTNRNLNNWSTTTGAQSTNTTTENRNLVSNSSSVRNPVPNSNTVASSRTFSSSSANQSSGSSRYMGWNNFKAATVTDSNARNSSPAPNTAAFDDGLDDLFLNDDWNFEGSESNVNNAENVTRIGAGNSNWDTSTSLNSNRFRNVENNLNNNRRSNTADDLNNSFNATMSWGSSGSTVTLPVSIVPEGTTIAGPTTSTSRQNIVKCTICNKVAKSFVVRKDGPNKGRPFYACTTSCNFFQWADVEVENNSSNSRTNQPAADAGSWSTVQSNNSNRVLCSCHKSAVERTVRKDGPNKGRQFYVCAKDSTSCEFFKWADENIQPNFNSESGPSRSSASDNGQLSWGTRNNVNNGNTDRNQQPSTSWGTGTRSNTSEPPSKKRKCSICRVEGHTKVRCPRKEEFENF